MKIFSKDLVFQWLTGNQDGVLSTIREQKVPKKTIHKMVETLKGLNVETSSLEALLETQPRTPAVGVTKVYSTHMSGETPYVRVPLSTLSVKQGDSIKVTFSDQEIVLTVGDGDEEVSGVSEGP